MQPTPDISKLYMHYDSFLQNLLPHKENPCIYIYRIFLMEKKNCMSGYMSSEPVLQF